jgi:GLPGLI family protein
MKKILIFTLLAVSLISNAQEFQGKAEYFCKQMFKNGVEEYGVKSDDDLRKEYEEALKKASEKIYILTFDKKEALYEKQQVLEQPINKCNGVTVSINFSGEGKKYINIQDQIKIEEDDIFGKEFLIVEKLNSLEWKLIDETKKIGEYTCYKAELIIPVSEKEKKEYEEYLKKQETKPSLFPMDEPKEKRIIAWYTPEIPVTVGPLNYWGLPGLILELNDGKMIILCSKVTLSNKENYKIKVPNNGTEVSQEEFDAIHKAKIESLEH